MWKMTILPTKLLQNLLSLFIIFLYQIFLEIRWQINIFHFPQFVDTLSAALAIIPTSNSNDYHVVSYGGKKSIESAMTALVVV